MAVEWKCEYCGYTIQAEDTAVLISQAKAHIRDEGGTILVYNTPDRHDEDEACLDLLDVGPPSQTAVIFLANEPEKQLHKWTTENEYWPERIGILTLDGDPLRRELLDDEILFNRVSNLRQWRTDSLGDLGEQIITMVSELGASAQYLTVCFDDFSTIINEFGNKTTFKMVTLLNAKMRKSGAIAHYHMTPSEHLHSTRNLFEEQFQLLRDLTTEESKVSIL